MKRIFIFVSIIALPLIALIYTRTVSPPSPVVFVRYLNFTNYADGSHDALFVIINTKAQWLDTSPDLAQIQIKSTFGWTDFTSNSPDDFVLKTGAIGAGPHEIYAIDRHVHQIQRPWRLHVTYTIRGQGTYDVYSKKMPGEPAR
jgi:hypothetical protein